eukprot:358091-Chlamydomonas_euryale.AAC.1
MRLCASALPPKLLTSVLTFAADHQSVQRAAGAACACTSMPSCTLRSNAIYTAYQAVSAHGDLSSNEMYVLPPYNMRMLSIAE